MRRLFAFIFCAAVVLLSSSCSVGRFAVNREYPQPHLKDGAQGILQEVFFPSSEPGMLKRRAFVYLPKEYFDNEERYPALYLLHGARGNECSWIEQGNLLHNIDSLYACHAMLPTIVVLPNVNQYNDSDDYGKARLKGALEAFYEVDGTVESRFVDDVVFTTDSLFRTIPDKQHRAIAGMSIGGMQSIYISASHPDTFGYVGLFSPIVHSFIKPGADKSFYRKLDDNMALQFRNPPELYMIMIGKTDFFKPAISSWDRKLTGKAYTHEFYLTPGGHQWYNWKEYSIRFMQRLWK